jgi:hypothetical protein
MKDSMLLPRKGTRTLQENNRLFLFHKSNILYIRNRELRHVCVGKEEEARGRPGVCATCFFRL